MRSLLDVNVLIALLDANHTLHEVARTWFTQHAGEGWASCPITQNGCMRILSHASYPGGGHPVAEVVTRLRAAAAHDSHEFWPDDISLLDDQRVDPTRVHGPRQLTDAYLLALAVAHGGRFVTFDGAIPLATVKGAKAENVLSL